MATYNPPWWITLPAGLVADITAGVWSSTQVPGRTYQSFGDLASAYQQLVGGANVAGSGAVNVSSAPAVLPINLQTGLTYTLVLSDQRTVVEMSNASANTVTVPPNSAVAFPVGAIIQVCQVGAGKTTLAPGAGVTIDSPGSLLHTSAVYATITLRKRATNEWVLEGSVG